MIPVWFLLETATIGFPRLQFVLLLLLHKQVEFLCPALESGLAYDCAAQQTEEGMRLWDSKPPKGLKATSSFHFLPFGTFSLGVPAVRKWVKNLTTVAQIAAQVQVQSPARELPYDMGAAFKKKKSILEGSLLCPPPTRHVAGSNPSHLGARPHEPSLTANIDCQRGRDPSWIF